MTTNTGATGDKGVPADKDAVTKPQIDTTNFDEAERIAEVNRRADVQEELDLAAEEKREPASWAVLDLPAEEEEEEEAELESEEEEVVEKKEEVVVKKEEPAAEDPLVKILVDGVEREVPLSKIVDAGKRTLQKESAADKRLEEASKLLKEAKEVTKLPAKAAEDSEASKLNLNKLRTDYVHASQYGTEEEAVAALTAWEEALVKKGTQPATPVVSQDDIKRVIKATELETLVNASPEEGGFSDLMSNPVLKEQTRVLVDNLVTNKQGSYDSFDTYKRAGEAVRLIGATLDPAYTPPVVVAKKKDSFENKRESKKKIVNIKPASAVSTSKVIEDPDKELSVSEEIAQMKAARGQ